MKRLITIAVAAVLLSGCVTTAQTTADTKTASNYSHAQMYVNMPYDRSVEAVSAWVNRCYPSGVSTAAIPFIADSGLIHVLTEEDQLTRVQVIPARTKSGLPNTFTSAGGVVVNMELTPDKTGTNVSVDAWQNARGWAMRVNKMIASGGLMSCWK